MNIETKPEPNSSPLEKTDVIQETFFSPPSQSVLSQAEPEEASHSTSSDHISNIAPTVFSAAPATNVTIIVDNLSNNAIESNNNNNNNSNNNNNNNNNNNIANVLTEENVKEVIQSYSRGHAQMPGSSSVRLRNYRNIKTGRLARTPGGQETVIMLRRGEPRLVVYDNIHSRYADNYRAKLIEAWTNPRTNRRTNTEVLAAITFMDTEGPESGHVFYISESPEHQEELRRLIRSVLELDVFNFDDVQNALDEVADR
jgi:hypothetical protein